MLLTEGTLLGGRVRYLQTKEGFRSGIEPVLLAASIPAQENQRVLEGGSGPGAGLLCLAARVRLLAGRGVERDAELVELARANAAANGFSHLEFVTADLLAPSPERDWDHAFANPPYHDRRGAAPPDPRRAAAKRAEGASVADWFAALARAVRPRGTITLILPPSRVPEVLGACEAAGCGSVCLFPLWPKQGRPAKLALLRAVRGGRAPLMLASGLVLHGHDGRFTPQAEEVLRGGASLSLG